MIRKEQKVEITKAAMYHAENDVCFNKIPNEAKNYYVIMYLDQKHRWKEVELC
jgi:hypothetical protein